MSKKKSDLEINVPKLQANVEVGLALFLFALVLFGEPFIDWVVS